MAPKVGKVSKEVRPVPIYDDVVVRDDDISDEISVTYQSLKIDGNNLAEEAENQPSILGRIALFSAEAASEARYAKRRLEIAKAELDSKIRREAASIGEKKPTETQIENMVTVDEDIQDLTEEWLIAEKNADILISLKQSVKDRRDLIVELMRDVRAEKASYGNE